MRHLIPNGNDVHLTGVSNVRRRDTKKRGQILSEGKHPDLLCLRVPLALPTEV